MRGEEILKEHVPTADAVTLAQRLAEYACSLRYSHLDGRTVKEMKARMVDAVGCALGAFDEPPVRIARKVALRIRPAGKSTLLGTGYRTSSELATFVNGLMVRYFDFNDTYLSKEPAHPSDNLGACLAVAEEEGRSGKELMAAAVAAYEIQCRLCDAADIRHRGWDHVNYGLVSSALAASVLMGLSPAQASEAVGIALNGHIAMRQVRAGELSMWKGASFANAARNGVFSAMLAREGMTGPAPIFEGEMGFFKQVSGQFRLDVGRFGGKGRPFKVGETYVKYWPAEYHAQTAIWAALDVRRRAHGSGRIRDVLVETHEAGFSILGKDKEKWRPGTKETADHSLPFIVGMALLHGTIDNATYSDSELKDRRNLAFVSKVRVREDPRLTSSYPAKGMPNRVTASIPGGETISSQVDVPRGHPLNPMSREEVDRKFIGLARRRMGARGARRAVEALWRIDEVENITGLLAKLSPG
ncbi:MAG: MmgE/PrpD family protein [Thaumarchaeota archaeon]|nr:MmgE/PrpD family protein [Nitrososphaerota archaeon]